MTKNTVETGTSAPQTAAGDAHSHTQGNVVTNTDQVTDVRPPFYDVAFLMKS